MLDGCVFNQGPEGLGTYDWLLVGARANEALIDSAVGVLLILVDHRGFVAETVAISHCPCSRIAPDPVACLGIHDVFIVDVPLMTPPRPRIRQRRRRSRPIRGKATESSDGPAGPSPTIAEISRRAA
jgi:hypothetical protein